MKKILVRSPNWIGDQVLAYPFFHYLRETYPHAHITVCCVPWVKTIQFKNLIDEVYVLPSFKEKNLYSKFQALEHAAKELKKMGPWDLAISLPHSFSSAWILFRSGAKKRRGYEGDGRSFLLNEVLKWESASKVHRAQAYAELITEIKNFPIPIREFWGTFPESVSEYNSFLGPHLKSISIPGVVDYFDAEKSWTSIHPISPPEVDYWVLAPGATAESRRWPLHYFKELATKITHETGWVGVIVGGENETPLAQQLIQDCPELKMQDWTGKGAVASYSKVFRNARFTVCNESGLAHIAALCGSFVQIICGAAKPQRTEPLGPGKVQVLFNPVECWPCEKNTCAQLGDKKLQCLMGIDPNSVWQKIKIGLSLSTKS